MLSQPKATSTERIERVTTSTTNCMQRAKTKSRERELSWWVSIVRATSSRDLTTNHQSQITLFLRGLVKRRRICRRLRVRRLIRRRPTAGLVEKTAIGILRVARRVPLRSGRRIFPMPRNPNVTRTFPMPVAADPSCCCARRCGPRFGDRRRRRTVHDDAARRSGIRRRNTRDVRCRDAHAKRERRHLKPSPNYQHGSPQRNGRED